MSVRAAKIVQFGAIGKKAGVFVLMMYFFFRAAERRKYQEERLPAASVGLLRAALRLKDKNSLRSNRLVLLDAYGQPCASRPADDAETACGEPLLSEFFPAPP